MPARVYDRLAGGSHSFAVDREMAAQLLAVEPDAEFWARQNREFLRRALRWSVDTAGVGQVLDIGCGMPETVGSAHQVTAGCRPMVRVLYVDNDPVAVASARIVARERAEVGDVAGIAGDLRDPVQIMTHPELTGFLHLDAPVVVLLGAVLHFVSDSDGPAGIIATLRDHVAPGSVLVISHATVPQGMTPEQVRITREYSALTAHLTFRTRDQVAELLAVFGDVVDPGVCKVADWRPEPQEQRLSGPERARRDRIPGWVGVAVKVGGAW
ncbi:SAM-dependent methyltransferase [Phytohabitans sp. ZYX-F-186]|uniref:SAM-dependent methyltransferase n=1 Tax=Phytohabitans maris TaxID=3071409 RepID=A0ABU0ZFX6_9ACTN|nr:SAM-dependent methyltransferase [Phytohabitans sp. ZYX-F-186]MDQ7905959.1 SAM-dependent methyltransferase [Phytohabitans sp. ZYX-F-186]